MTARILVVDDVPVNIRLLEAKLSSEYFDVLTAGDGHEALRVAREGAPDLILLDVMMPGLDGFEVCKRLKGDAKTAHIPVIMVTALNDSTNKVKGLQCGADDFLSKPVNDLTLFSRVRSLVRLKLLLDELRVRQAALGTTLIDDEEVESKNQIPVLVVSSQQNTSKRVISTLEETGYKVTQCRNQAEALSLSRSATFDLVFVDLHIEGEDGLRFCSQLRSQDETRQIPILLIIDEGDVQPLAKGLDIGVTDYLIRPIDPNELLARTRTQVRRRRYHNRLTSLIDSSVALAYTDALTGVYNRRYMRAHLDRNIMTIAETPDPLSVLIFDLDHFKDINDRLGHAAGDKVLREVAQSVAKNLRQSDLVARYGGEEFVVIMPRTSVEIAAQVADRLRSRLEGERIELGDGRGVTVTVSIGVAETRDPNEIAEALIARADEALYSAKRGGRNCVRVYGAESDASFAKLAG